MKMSRYKSEYQEKINDSYIKNFIKSNTDSSSEKYKIEDLYEVLVAEKFKKETGHYISLERGSLWVIPSIDFSTRSESYEDILRDYKNFIQQSPLNKQEILEKSKLSFIKSYLRGSSSETLSVNEYGVDALLYLLDYVINGEIKKDLGPVHKIIQKYSQTSTGREWYPSNLAIEELKPLVLTIQKNRKVKLKGLTKKHHDEINRLIKLLDI